MIVVALFMVGGSLCALAGAGAMFNASLRETRPEPSVVGRSVGRPVSSSRVIGLDRDVDGVYRAGRVR